MRILFVLASLLVLATSAAASQTGHRLPPSIESKQGAVVSRASLLCMDQSFGGSCPTALRQCQMECDEGYAEDTLRCMSGAGGILVAQRAVCHAKAAGVYGFCLKSCSDIYG